VQGGLFAEQRVAAGSSVCLRSIQVCLRSIQFCLRSIGTSQYRRPYGLTRWDQNGITGLEYDARDRYLSIDERIAIVVPGESKEANYSCLEK
jgi:hypothetical protein